jgi:colanic acid/amylovoran biosynthesis glycosyltransferase
VKQRIAYIVNIYPKVSHTFIRREIAALRAQGVEVTTIAMRGWLEPVTDEADVAERASTQYVVRRGFARVALDALQMLLSRPSAALAALRLAMQMARYSEKSYGYHFIYWAEACSVSRIVEKNQCKHLHAHFGTNGAEVAMLAARISGSPYSFTVHGPEEFDAPRGFGLPILLRRAKFVVAISSFARSQLYRLMLAEDWPKVHVVHCGLDSSFLSAPVDHDGLASRQLVCVGRLCEQKGQALLLQALRTVLDRGVDCSLILAGDGEMREAMVGEIRRLGLAEKVTITGWISGARVRELLASSRCLVLPSFAEGLPVVIMESMALGRPVLSTYVAGIPELVRNGVDGWLVAAGDVAPLADAMEAALTATPASLQAMGDSARVRVRARHDINTEAGKLRLLFAASGRAHSTTPDLNRGPYE